MHCLNVNVSYSWENPKQIFYSNNPPPTPNVLQIKTQNVKSINHEMYFNVSCRIYYEICSNL